MRLRLEIEWLCKHPLSALLNRPDLGLGLARTANLHLPLYMVGGRTAELCQGLQLERHATDTNSRAAQYRARTGIPQPKARTGISRHKARTGISRHKARTGISRHKARTGISRHKARTGISRSASTLDLLCSPLAALLAATLLAMLLLTILAALLAAALLAMLWVSIS